MPVTTIPHHSPGPSSVRNVDVDWSNLAPDADGLQPSVDDLISWVSNCPRPSGIRVYLPPVRQRAALHKLRHSLLSLGVTVTCRMRSA